MILAIHQPEYFPPIRYFHKAVQAGALVLLTSKGVMFDRASQQHRAKISVPRGTGFRWLTIPFTHSGYLQELYTVRSEEEFWPRHWRILCEQYRRAPYFEQLVELGDYFGSVAQSWVSGCSIARCSGWSVSAVLTCLGLGVKVFWSMEPDMAFVDWGALPLYGRTERLVRLCQEHRATTYLSGVTGAAYLDRDLFEQAGIAVQVHRYTPPSGIEYSVLHSIATLGVDETRRQILGEV